MQLCCFLTLTLQLLVQVLALERGSKQQDAFKCKIRLWTQVAVLWSNVQVLCEKYKTGQTIHRMGNKKFAELKNLPDWSKTLYWPSGRLVCMCPCLPRPNHRPVLRADWVTQSIPAHRRADAWDKSFHSLRLKLLHCMQTLVLDFQSHLYFICQPVFYYVCYGCVISGLLTREAEYEDILKQLPSTPWKWNWYHKCDHTADLSTLIQSWWKNSKWDSYYPFLCSQDFCLVSQKADLSIKNCPLSVVAIPVLTDQGFTSFSKVYAGPGFWKLLVQKSGQNRLPKVL